MASVASRVPDAIATLQQEHRYMGLLLETLEEQLQKPDLLMATDFYLLQDIVQYMHEYPDTVHHPTEDLLFEKLVIRDPSSKDAVLHLQRDHVKLSERTAKILQLLERASAEQTSGAADAVRTALRTYVKSLRRHMRREENELFPKAAACLANRDWKAIEARLSATGDPLFGRKVHGDYRVLYEYFSGRGGGVARRLTRFNLLQIDNLILSADALEKGAGQMWTMLKGHAGSVTQESRTAVERTLDSRSLGAAAGAQLGLVTYLGKKLFDVGNDTADIFLKTSKRMLAPHLRGGSSDRQNPHGALNSGAGAESLPARAFTARGLPDFEAAIRTGMVYGSLIPSFTLGIPGWLLNRSRRELINLAISTWGDFGSSVAGLDVRVEGEEHLWSHRPAVFVFNHQSAADALIVSRLLRRDFTGVAKAEIKTNPIVGTFLKAVGAVFIDRSNKEQAIEALKPAVENLRNGISLAIAPEGQRSVGYALGPFKKGAFHIAMQAGVPVVAIVIANSADALPKYGFLIHPAPVDVTVLPPVATATWKTATIDEHVESVRQRFLRELGQAVDKDSQLRRVG